MHVYVFAHSCACYTMPERIGKQYLALLSHTLATSLTVLTSPNDVLIIALKKSPPLLPTMKLTRVLQWGSHDSTRILRKFSKCQEIS